MLLFAAMLFWVLGLLTSLWGDTDADRFAAIAYTAMGWMMYGLYGIAKAIRERD